MFNRYLHLNYRLYSAVRWFVVRRVTPMGWLVLVGLVATAGLGADTNLSQTHQIFTLLLMFVLLGVAGTRLKRPRLSGKRLLPRFGTAGEPLAYRVEVRNHAKAWQRGLSLSDQPPDPRPSLEEFASTPEPGESRRNWFDRRYRYYRWQWLSRQNQRAATGEIPLPPLPPLGAMEVDAAMTPLRRGRLTLDRLIVAAPESFGLFRGLRKVAASAQTLLVLPRRYPLPPLALPGSLQYQPGGVTLASSVGQSEEFTALRDYRPGDPFRHIHWRSFARLGRPVVKEFQDEFFVRHALVLDTFGNLEQREIFEEAVSVAASFACAVLTQESLLDLLFVGAEAYCFTAGRGLAHTEQMLEILASVQPCRDKPFAVLEQRVLGHLGSVSGCLCVFLAWDEARKNFVAKMRQSGLPLWVFVIAGAEEAPDPGPMSDAADCFHVLSPGKIAEQLVRLGR